MFKIFAIGLALVLSWISGVQADDICQAVALRNVPALGDPNSIALKKGEVDTAVSQYRIDKKSGQASFCSHGGSCYPADIIGDGGRVVVLKLTNCKVGAEDTSNADEDFRYFVVEVVRAKNLAKALRYDDLDNRLLEMGLCTACAGNAADSYIKHPASKCGSLVRKALEGNPKAQSILNEDPNYCLEK